MEMFRDYFALTGVEQHHPLAACSNFTAHELSVSGRVPGRFSPVKGLGRHKRCGDRPPNPASPNLFAVDRKRDRRRPMAMQSCFVVAPSYKSNLQNSNETDGDIASRQRICPAGEVIDPHSIIRL